MWHNLPGAGIWDLTRWHARHHRLQNLEQEVLSTLDNLPQPASSLEADYQLLLRAFFQAKATQAAESSRRFQDMTDYYTLWAHQIKTPIAAMDLILQTQDFPESGGLKQSLFQIQQYVEMVLCYLRLDSETTDFVIRTCPWTPSSAPPCGSSPPSFIRKTSSSTTSPCPAPFSPMRSGSCLFWSSSCPTPSNTPPGSVTIRLEEPQTLVIEDTGLGIAPEDLPRSLRRATPGSRGGRTSAPPASACTSAAAPSASWAIPSPSNPPQRWAPPSASISSASPCSWSNHHVAKASRHHVPQICPIAFFSKTGYNKEHHAEHTAGIGKGF